MPALIYLSNKKFLSFSNASRFKDLKNYSFSYPFKASAPPTISKISLVIAA